MALQGILPPAIVTAVALAIALRSGGAGMLRSPWRAFSIGAGFVAAYAVLFGWTGWPPAEAWMYLPWIAVAFGALGTVAAARPLPAPAQWVLLFALAALATWATIEPLFDYYEWSTFGSVWRVAALALGWTLLAAGTDRLADRRPGASLPMVLAVAATGASLITLEAGFAKSGQLGGALATSAGVAVSIAWLRPQLTLGRGGTFAATGILFGLVLNAFFFLDDLSEVAAVCLVVAPLFAWFGELGVVRSRPAWQGAVIRAGLTAVPLAIAGAMILLRAEDGAYPY